MLLPSRRSSPHDGPLRQLFRKVRHIALGQISVKTHGRLYIAKRWMLALALFPAGCAFSCWRFTLRRHTLICIARNGHLNASHFLEDFEPLKRSHHFGELADVEVIFVADRIPIGKAVWDRMKASCGMRIARVPMVLRCAPSNRYVKRRYLPICDDPTVRVPKSFNRSIRALALPPVPERVPVPQEPSFRRAATLAAQPAAKFIAAQSQRPELYQSLQTIAKRRAVEIRTSTTLSQFPAIETYYQALAEIEKTGTPVIDLWNTVGNPAHLLPDVRQLPSSTKSDLDRVQADIFAKCEVFLANASGAWWIAWALGRPTLVANAYGQHFGDPITMFIPIRLWDRIEKRLLTLSEMYCRPGIWHHFGRLAQSTASLEIIYNSSAEIVEAVHELRSLCRGGADLDPDLQDRVSQILESASGQPKGLQGNSIIGQAFLRRHPELLN